MWNKEVRIGLIFGILDDIENNWRITDKVIDLTNGRRISASSLWHHDLIAGGKPASAASSFGTPCHHSNPETCFGSMV